MPYFTHVCRSLGLLVVTAVLAISTMAFGADQSTAPAQGREVGPEGVIKGDICVRRSDTHPGIVKVDACGRWYCGRVDINDITVLNPHFAEDMQCRWTLINEKCKCVR